MSDNSDEDISYHSTKEEVAEFFKNYLKLEDEIQKNLINEYISGDALSSLSEEDFKYIGLKLGPIKKWFLYYNKNKDKFKKIEIKGQITINSTSEEVGKFFESYLYFKENSKNINGKKLMELNEADMKKLGMKLGQRKRLISYINHVDNNISINSSFEEVSQFLRNKLNISENSIKELALDGEALFSLKYNDIDELDLIDKEKESFKKFIDKKNTNKIQPLNERSNYNIFIIIGFKENYYKNILISFQYIKDNSKIRCEYRILDIIENIYEEEVCKSYLIQIQLKEIVTEINIIFEKDKNIGFEPLKIKIEKINNFFFFNKLNLFDNKIVDLSINDKFKEYYKYLCNEKSNNKEKFVINMIESLIENTEKIKFNGNNILIFLKLYVKYQIKSSLENKIIYNKIDNLLIENENILLDNELDNLISNSEIIKLLANIYIFEIKDKEYFLEILSKSKYKNDFCKAIFNLLDEKVISPKDLFIFNKDKILFFQEMLLEVISSRKDMDYIIEISKNLVNCLKFVMIFYLKIVEKINSLSYFFENYYQIKFDNLEINEDIANIIGLTQLIFKISNDKSYYLIDYEKLFLKLENALSSENLDYYCILYKFINFCEKDISQKTKEKFYNNIHTNGINKIKNKQMNFSQIINFIIHQDIYYFDPKYKKSEKREPKIIKYINITDVDKNYLENIEVFKNLKLYNIFIDSNYETEKKFYSIIIEKIKKLKDIKTIMDIFPLKIINKDFTLLINSKIDEFKNTFECGKDLFEVLDFWMNINLLNKLDPKYVIDIRFTNIDISNKYLIYLLSIKKNNRKMNLYKINLMKDMLLKINIQNMKQKKDPQFLINLLVNSECEEELCLYFLKRINKISITEKDFYSHEKSLKFVIFKAFLENCKNIFEKYKNKEGTYTHTTNIKKCKILETLYKGDKNFNDFQLFIKDKNLESKIKLITSGEEEAKLLYSMIKNNFEQCLKDYNIIKNLIDYYTTFYPKTKEEIINKLIEKEKEYKKKTIHELIDNFDLEIFLGIDNFYLKEAIEESSNLKYKNSSFFMIIYINNYAKYNSEKSEEKILKESIKIYIDTFKEIIEKLELKLSLHNINGIEMIVKDSLNDEFNIDKEIDFIKENFSFLNKTDYIAKYLKNNFMEFLEEFQFVKLINGIIQFIDYNYKVNENKPTRIFISLKNIYNSIVENNINEENINKFVDSLKSNEFYINSDNILIQFYRVLSEKKESILFLKNIKDSIINRKENLYFNNNINNKLNIYI